MSDDQDLCELCGEPMPPGETMFKFHGYSGPCPKPPLTKQNRASRRYNSDDTFSLLVDKIQSAMNETGLLSMDVREAADVLEHGKDSA